MYLIDTDVISELRKGAKTNRNVLRFFADADKNDHALYLSVVIIGELRRGVEIIRHRKDTQQAKRLEAWLEAPVARLRRTHPGIRLRRSPGMGSTTCSASGNCT